MLKKETHKISKIIVATHNDYSSEDQSQDP